MSATKPNSLSPPRTHIALGRRCPIFRHHAQPHVAMYRTVRPIFRMRDVAMHHRIDMHLVDVASEIVIVNDQMLPEAALPDAAAAIAATCIANPLALRHRS